MREKKKIKWERQREGGREKLGKRYTWNPNRQRRKWQIEILNDERKERDEGKRQSKRDKNIGKKRSDNKKEREGV